VAGGATRQAATRRGPLDLRGTAARCVIWTCTSVDTGPTHLAAALEVPMIGLYHCFHRGRRFAPLGHKWLRIVDHPSPDNLCARDSNMADIAVNMVWKYVQELLIGNRVTAPSI
jgi:ADP-heptose:LPS heptosyltransferase